MRTFLKLFFKAISMLLIILIILTLIIALTKLSKPSEINVDLASMNSIQRETFLNRYGGDLNITKFSSIENLKVEVIDYYKKLFKGDLGWIYRIVRSKDAQGNYISVRENIEPIHSLLKTGFIRSMKLLVSAISISITLGIIKGVSDSKKEKKDNSSLKLFTTVVGLSVPVIFLAPLLQFIVRWINYTYGFKFALAGHETFSHMILPTIVLSILPMMYIARITAVSMDKVYEDEFIRTAISKGNSKLRVTWIHVFRNSIVEICGSLPAVLTIIISDLAIVEYLFDYRGLTHMMVDYYGQGQSDAVTGLALVLCAIYLFFFLLFKLLKFVLDPKSRRATI